MGLAGRARAALKQALAARMRQRNAALQPLPPATWGLEVVAGRLRLDGLDLAGLADRWGSPLHVVHAEALVRNVAAFRCEAEGDPPVDVFYSYKTNPIPAVLALMHARGIGAEVISAYELWLARRLGVPPERIIYNGPVKSAESVREAIAADVLLINANHAEEIPSLAAAAHALGRRPRVGVRVSAPSTWGGQFGAPIATGEALAALRRALAEPSLDVCALHLHPGFNLRTAEALGRMVGEAMDFVATAWRELKFAPRFLDLGGSLGIPTVAPTGFKAQRMNRALLADLAPPDPAAMITIPDYVRQVQATVRRRCAAIGLAPPAIVLEPGRAMTGNTQLLVATVQAARDAVVGPPYAILDAGINLAQSMQGEYHQVYPAAKMAAPRTTSVRLAGPICSPGDVVRWAVTLPPLVPGDRLVIMDAGAYFVPFATSFSFPQPAIVMVEGGRERLVRRAETFEDQVALDVGLP